MKRGVIVVALLLVLCSSVFAIKIEIEDTTPVGPQTSDVDIIAPGKLKSKVTRHVYGLGHVADVTNGEVTYLHQDRLGSTRLVTDSNGEVVGEFKSLPFGQEIVNDDVRYSFATGKELDSSGLYYFGARYYDPNIGRFTSVDPIKDNHAYSYVSNNPMGFVDPSGMRRRKSGIKDEGFELIFNLAQITAQDTLISSDTFSDRMDTDLPLGRIREVQKRGNNVELRFYSDDPNNLYVGGDELVNLVKKVKGFGDFLAATAKVVKFLSYGRISSDNYVNLESSTTWNSLMVQSDPYFNDPAVDDLVVMLFLNDINLNLEGKLADFVNTNQLRVDRVAFMRSRENNVLYAYAFGRGVNIETGIDGPLVGYFDLENDIIISNFEEIPGDVISYSYSIDDFIYTPPISGKD